VARYGKDHKQATRARIVDAAGRRFKQDGIDGSGIAILMADAGLTNGAFYAHFASKDDLVAAAVAHELETQAAAVDDVPPGRAGLEAYLRAYLSAEHRDNPAAGCPAAALLDELGRSAAPARRAFADGADALFGAIADRLEADDPSSAREVALAIYALLVGTLQLSRALPDRQRADEVLEAGLRAALTLADSATHP